MSDWTVRDTNRGNSRDADSRNEAETIRDDLLALGARPDDVEILSPDDGAEGAESTEDSSHNPQGSGGETPAVSRADGVREETLPGTDDSRSATEDSTEEPAETTDGGGVEFQSASPVDVADSTDTSGEPAKETTEETTGETTEDTDSHAPEPAEPSEGDDEEIPYKSVPGGSAATEPEDYDPPASTEEPAGNSILPENPPVDTDPVEWLPSHFVDTIQGVPTVNRKGYAVIASQYGISVTAEPLTLPSETGFEYAEFRAVAVTPDGKEYSGHGESHTARGDDGTMLGALAETRAMKRAVAWASGVGLTAAVEMRGD